jgi:T5SS/PEP-CTERM-associated repeat protein
MDRRATPRRATILTMNNLSRISGCISARRLAPFALAVGMALAAPVSGYADTYPISGADDVYCAASIYDGGSSPEGYYFDYAGTNATDFTTTSTILDLTVYNCPTFVGYDTGHTVTYTIASATVLARDIDIGYSTASNGTVTLKDGGALSSSGEIAVGTGANSTGTLKVEGGNVTASTITLGKSSSSTGTLNLSGSGSSVTATNTLTVATNAATGTLTVSNGATLTDTNGFVANQPDSVGNVTISGAGSLWLNNASLSVGQNYADHPGRGSIVVEDGALLAVGSKAGGFTLSMASNSAIDLKDGYFALYGDQTADKNQFLSGAGLKIWDGTEYVAATTSNATVKYYETSMWNASDSLYATYGGKIDLTGYTLVEVSTVPEPATYAFFGGLGAAALVLFRKRLS